MTTTESERAERIRRLQERRGTAASAPRPVETTQPLEPVDVTKEGPVQGQQPRPSPAAKRRQGDGSRKRSHKAEASRMFAVGASATLTLSLIALMAKADDAAAEPPIDLDPFATTFHTYSVWSATAPNEITQLAPASPANATPVILTPIQRRTTVVYAGGSSRASSSSGTHNGGGGAPVANTGGGSVSSPPPPPPPPPAPASSSNGSG